MKAPLVIVGPTASGKTALALAVAAAARVDGVSCEIVSADAMAVYRGMNIGTAKPDTREQALVPHHLIDVVEPTEDFGVSRYQELALAAIAQIEERDRAVILVGGTGLYIQAVVDGFTMPGRFPEARARIENEPDTAALYARLCDLDPVAADKMLATNRRRIIRALEVSEGSGQPFSSFGPGVDHYPGIDHCLVGIEIDRQAMDERIAARYQRQMEAGFRAEVEALATTGLSRTASQALGYKELLACIRGECSEAEAVAEAVRRTRKFARRQQRWFRRDPRIGWIEATEVALADTVLARWREMSS